MNSPLRSLLPRVHAFTDALDRLVPLAIATAGLAFFAGCADEPESHVVSSPPPGAVTTTTTAVAGNQVVASPPVAATSVQTPSGTVVLNQAPPAAPQVVVARPARPSDYSAWVEGHWTYRDERYEWINGHWEVPPHSGEKWIQPHTETRSDGKYDFYEGYWSDT